MQAPNAAVRIARGSGDALSPLEPEFAEARGLGEGECRGHCRTHYWTPILASMLAFQAGDMVTEA